MHNHDHGNGNGDRIQRRMAEVREHLDQDLRQLAGSAKSMTDWRTYVRRNPWVFLGGAALLGYLLVPRRRQMVTLHPRDLHELGRRLAAPATIQKPPAQASFAGAIVSSLAGFAFRRALRAVDEHLARRRTPPQNADYPQHEGSWP